MAAAAMSAEIGLAGFRIACDDVEDLVIHAIGRGLTAREEKSGDVSNLCIGEAEGGHALGRTSMQNDRPNFGTGSLVVQNENGVDEVRSTVPAAGVAAVAKRAGSNKDFLTASGGGWIG